MAKTTVHLDENRALSLRDRSRRLGKPQAALIRDAIQKFASENVPPPLPTGIGKFSSRRTDISQNYRKLVKKAVQQTRWP
jgi:hypothetical protein